MQELYMKKRILCISGMEKMNAYYESAAKMNNTIIEYVNGMEVVKVFNKDGDYRYHKQVDKGLEL